MIKYHPDDNLLTSFVEGQLPTSLSVAVAAHVQLCDQCKQAISSLTVEAANHAFEDDKLADTHADIDMMIDSITADDMIEFPVELEPVIEKLKGQRYELPQSISALQRTKWLGLGKLSRARLIVDEGNVHASLLHIDKNGYVPEHTHNGFELTLLLDGSFEDDFDCYHKGDFIWLDNHHQHSPKTTGGCLCYTVVSDSLQFTSGLSKLLNPIGSFIY